MAEAEGLVRASGLLSRLRAGLAEALRSAEEQPPEAYAPLEDEEPEHREAIRSSIPGVPDPPGLDPIEGVEVYGVDLGSAGLGPYRVEAVTPGFRVAGVDGSSRSLSGGGVAFSIASAAVSGGGVLAVYPGLSHHAAPAVHLEAGLKPLSVAVPSLDTGGHLESVASVRPLVYMEPGACGALESRYASACRRLASYWGYQRNMMADENRILVETAALAEAAGLRAGLVLVDGPIYATPGLFERLSKMAGRLRWGGRELYSLAYAASYVANIALRAHVIAKVFDGRGVVGVVKRIGASKTLIHALRQAGAVEERVAQSLPGDEELLRVAVARARGRARPSALAFGPVLVEVRLGKVLCDIDEVLSVMLGVRGPGCRGKPIDAWTPEKEGLLPRLRDDYVRLARLVNARIPGGSRDLYAISSILQDAGGQASGSGDGREAAVRKLALYLAVPHRPDWMGGFTLLRLEAPVGPVGPREAWRILAGAAEAVAHEALRAGAGKGLPLAIIAADSAAKQASRALALAVYHGVSDIVRYWDYETMVSVGE